MYIESKSGENTLTGDARIGRVTFSKTGKSIHYNGRTCADRLYGERLPIYIDDDIREEYWTKIRNLPNCINIKVING